MNKFPSRLTISTSIITQLARQAADQVKEIGYHSQAVDSEIVVEKPGRELKGWAFTGWEPPQNPEPTGLPGF